MPGTKTEDLDAIDGRSFRVWLYRVSLQSLLVRSPITESFSTNVELFFFGVAHLSGPTSLGRLTISCLIGEELAVMRAAFDDDRLQAWVLHGGTGDLTITGIGMGIEENKVAFFEWPEHYAF